MLLILAIYVGIVLLTGVGGFATARPGARGHDFFYSIRFALGLPFAAVGGTLLVFGRLWIELAEVILGE